MADPILLAESELAVVLAVLDDVMAGRAYFSHGEMTTITNWSKEQLTHLMEGLKRGRRVLSAEERVFVGASLYHWAVAAKHGRTVANEALRSAARDLLIKL